MIDLTPAFGPSLRVRTTWNPIIVIRHGILSSDAPFQPLANWLQNEFPNATVDNQSYAWRQSILLNGARLAEYIRNQYPAGRDLILVGHSMGGLVCRVAACFLSGNAFPSAAALANGYTQTDVQAVSIMHFEVRAVNGIIGLATPNSGAMLHGQISGLAGWLKLLVNMSHEGIKDLTTDRLFRVFQSFAVTTKLLTISGSNFNRFSQASGQLSNWLRRGGIRLELPHDRVVEDRSVDLASSILPNELLHQGKSIYLHLRAYESCTDITHTNIYNDPVVQQYIADFMCRC